MSIDLIDLRAKITELTDVVLDVQHNLTGKDRSEIVREVLHEWASKCEREASVLVKALESKGMTRKGQ